MRHAAPTFALLLLLLLAGCPSDAPPLGSGGDVDASATDVTPDAGPTAHPDDLRLTALRRPGLPGILVDPAGREVLLRGINVNSYGEYWTFDEAWGGTLPFTAADMDFIAGMGFNLVRLIITWSLVEPAPGEYDDAYLAQVAVVTDQLWERGIYTLVDLHQDAWGPTLAHRPDEACGGGETPAAGWDGAPGWATLVDDATLRCAPIFDGHPVRELSPAVLEAWDAFFTNTPGPGGVGLLDRYAAMLGHVAEAFAPHHGVMGYDLMNEPNALLGDDQLAQLADLYERSLTALRGAEARAGIAPRIVLFEPSALWPNTKDGQTTPKFSDDPQLAYGPHIYQGSIGTQPLDDAQLQRLRDEAAAYGGVPILCGEWGGGPGSAGEAGGYFERMIALQDQERWGMALWVYSASCGDPHNYFTAQQDNYAGIKPWGIREMHCVGDNRVGDVHQAYYDRMARPALHYAPGIIADITWDPTGRIFEASGDNAAEGAELVLYLPSAHTDLVVDVTGVGPVEATPWHGGSRVVGPAMGGEWSLRAAP